jgi:hypothetical protein
LPPSPAFTRIIASSMNMLILIVQFDAGIRRKAANPAKGGACA